MNDPKEDTKNVAPHQPSEADEHEGGEVGGTQPNTKGTPDELAAKHTGEERNANDRH